MNKLFIFLILWITQQTALMGQAPFIGKWTATESIIIPAYGSFEYEIALSTDASITASGVGDDFTIISLPSGFPSGDYLVTLTPTGAEPLHRLAFLDIAAYEPANFKEIIQWGDVVWSSMEGMFWGCNFLTSSATDIPNLSNVTNMSSLFRHCYIYDTWIGLWDVSGVTNMSHMFSGAILYNQSMIDWDVSNVIDMSYMFNVSLFNQTLDTWDVSSVTNMEGMFQGTGSFNQNLATWDVSNVTNMSGMFQSAVSFNQNIGGWNVGQVTNMSNMFNNAKLFHQNINGWDVSQVTDMSFMFYNAEAFNYSLNNWDVGNVVTMESMFEKCILFHQSLNNWDVSNVENMANMFFGAQNFNGSIGNWDVSNVENMSGLFRNTAAFNQPLNDWDVSNVTNMSFMFSGAQSFNQPLNDWNIGSVNILSNMFSHAEVFNQNISSWDVSQITHMDKMFYYAMNYNQPLNEWNVTALKDMNSMFGNAFAFNQPLDLWDVRNLENFENAFENASAFNQNLGNWKLENLISAKEAFWSSGMDCENYSYTINGWNAYEGTAHAVNATDLYNGGYGAEAVDARGELISDKGWILTGDVLDYYCITPCINDSIYLTGAYTLEAVETGEVVTYQWIKCGEPMQIIESATTATFTATETGEYAVIITKGDCVDTSACLLLTLPSGLEDPAHDQEKISLAPNPALDEVSVKSAVKILSVSVYDVTGKVWYTSNIGQKQFSIKIAQLPAGQYLMRLSTVSGNQIALRFVKGE